MHRTLLTLGALGMIAALILNGCTDSSKPGDNGTTTAHDPDDGHSHGDDTHTHDDSGATTHGHDEVSLGSTTLGDMTIGCAQGHGELGAGKEMHLVVKLPYNDKGASIVRAWIGTEDRLNSLVGKGEYAPSHDDYDIHVEAPDPLPIGVQWWIEVEKPDGTTTVGSIAAR